MENYMKTLLALVAIAFTLSPTAFAGLSQISKHFPAQTAALSATTIVSTPTYSGSYVISLYATQNSANCGISNITYTLRWNDENDDWRSVSMMTPHTNPPHA